MSDSGEVHAPFERQIDRPDGRRRRIRCIGCGDCLDEPSDACAGASPAKTMTATARTPTVAARFMFTPVEGRMVRHMKEFRRAIGIGCIGSRSQVNASVSPNQPEGIDEGAVCRLRCRKPRNGFDSEE
ncbi:hypothetical protein ACWEOH_06505 [Agromyces sp. NPDC004153]